MRGIQVGRDDKIKIQNAGIQVGRDDKIKIQNAGHSGRKR
jgi:hypothetical protein